MFTFSNKISAPRGSLCSRDQRCLDHPCGPGAGWRAWWCPWMLAHRNLLWLTVIYSPSPPCHCLNMLKVQINRSSKDKSRVGVAKMYFQGEGGSQVFSWIFRTKLKTGEIRRDRLAVLVSPARFLVSNKGGGGDTSRGCSRSSRVLLDKVRLTVWYPWTEERILWIEMYWARKGDWPVNVDLQLLLA